MKDFDDECCDDASVARDAVDNLLRAVERPVGKLTFSIVNQKEFDAALLALCDAVGREVMGA